MRHDDSPPEELLRRALEEADGPPPTPREAIWARIEAERGRASGPAPVAEPAPAGAGATDTGAADTGVTDIGGWRAGPARSAPRWIPRTLGWGAALAATLAIGIALGREQVRRQVDGRGTAGPSPVAETAAGAPAEVPTAYRVAAAQHLEETEALFASLAVDASTGGTDEVSGWARTLLTDTRLLLGSPAGADPALRALLGDLELVLSQIAMIPAGMAQEEVELIQEGINRSDVLVRMRAAAAAPVGPGTVSYQGRVDR